MKSDKKICCIMLVSLLCMHDCHATEYVAKNYIVMESKSGQVLEGKDIHDTQSVASISKIMTAIVAIENDDLNRKVLIGEEIKKAYGSGVYIHQGDQITIQDLLYGTLLRSGNDAALCLAYHVGGKSVSKFVDMMNEKAKTIGMQDTIFHNPTGLDEEDEGNISSVYDMALLMRYCMQNDAFREVTSTKQYKRQDGNGLWHNKNKLLQLYEHTTGGKTGFTKKAKRTLVSTALKDDIELIVVTFNCGDDFSFHQNLYETYFSIYQNVLCLERGIYQVEQYQFCVEEAVYQKLLEKKALDFKVTKDYIEVYLNRQLLEKYPIHDFPIKYFLRLYYE